MSRSDDLPFDKKRVIVLHEAGWVCAMCGGEATEADHIWPRKLGGPDSLDNLQAACRRCNAKKGGKFYLDDLTPARVDLLLPQLREEAIAAIERVARWIALRDEIIDGDEPTAAYYRRVDHDHVAFEGAPAGSVRQVLAEAWRHLLHETPGHAALDALAELERFHLIDAEEIRLGDLTRNPSPEDSHA